VREEKKLGDGEKTGRGTGDKIRLVGEIILDHAPDASLPRQFFSSSLAYVWAMVRTEAGESSFFGTQVASLTVWTFSASVYWEREGRESVRDGRLPAEGSAPGRREKTDLW